MPQQVALLCCVLFILWLFVRDAKRRKVSFALWIPLAWAFIIGSKPISTWLGYGDTSGGADSYVEGSPFDRMVFLFLIAAGCFVLVKRGINWSRFFRNNRWLCIYFLYLGISALWSDYPFVSFKRWIKDLGNVVMVLVILSEMDPTEAVKAVFVRCAYILVPLSVIFIKYFPDVGRYYNRWTWTFSYGGVTTDKNMLGLTLVVSGIF